jgi:hypothetical protein
MSEISEILLGDVGNVGDDVGDVGDDVGDVGDDVGDVGKEMSEMSEMSETMRLKDWRYRYVSTGLYQVSVAIESVGYICRTVLYFFPLPFSRPHNQH